MKGIITHIQRMSLHDGPGIRTTVFMKGCNFRCKWCHNPETFLNTAELEWIKTKCIRCKKCIAVCKNNALTFADNNITFNKNKCNSCFECTDVCFAEALNKVGRSLTSEQLVNEIANDFIYFKNSSGGVTFSGGEPMLQSNFVIDALKLFKQQEIHTAIETNLSLNWEIYKRAIPYIDLILADLKIFTSEAHYKWTGAKNKNVLDNFFMLNKTDVPYIIRTPLIPNVNDNMEQKNLITDFISKLKNCKQHQWIPYHNLAEYKYKNLGYEFTSF